MNIIEKIKQKFGGETVVKKDDDAFLVLPICKGSDRSFTKSLTQQNKKIILNSIVKR